MEHESIQDLYLRAIYAFKAAKRATELTFVRSATHGEVTGVLHPAPTWAILSARNPMSQTLNEAENLLRDQELTTILAERRITHAPAEGRSADGAWREPSRLLPSVPRADALDLARRFNQHSIIWAQSGKVGLLDVRTECWIVRTAFAVTSA